MSQESNIFVILQTKKTFHCISERIDGTMVFLKFRLYLNILPMKFHL